MRHQTRQPRMGRCRGGFTSHEFLFVWFALAVLLLAGALLSGLIGLHGRYRLIPPAALIGAAIGWVVLRNILESVRDKRNK